MTEEKFEGVGIDGELDALSPRLPEYGTRPPLAYEGDVVRHEIHERIAVQSLAQLELT